MKRFPFLRTLLVAMFAAAAAIPTLGASAAIPCQELPVIEPDPNMVIPMIYIELPVTLEAAFSRVQPVDRTESRELDESESGKVISASENQFRCLGYGMDTAFAGNSTPGQRVSMWAAPEVREDEQYIELDSLFLERLGQPIGLADGRYLVDYGVIVDGETYLTGELVFLEEENGLYLDWATVVQAVELGDEPVEIELSERFTREAKIVHVQNGDHVVFDNLSEESAAEIEITDAQGETIFEGHAKPEMMVGSEDRNIFVVHNLEPGEYQITVTFTSSDVVYGETLVVEENGLATPVATPESTPLS